MHEARALVPPDKALDLPEVLCLDHHFILRVSGEDRQGLESFDFRPRLPLRVFPFELRVQEPSYGYLNPLC